MRALEHWRTQELTRDSRERLTTLLDAQREEPWNQLRQDELLDDFLITLNEAQLCAFARMLRELTDLVH